MPYFPHQHYEIIASHTWLKWVSTYWHFEPDNSLRWELPCALQSFSSISDPYPLDASTIHPTTIVIITKKSPDIAKYTGGDGRGWMAKSPQIKNHCLIGFLEVTKLMWYIINHLEECLAYHRDLLSVSYCHAFAHAVPAAWDTIPSFFTLPTPTFMTDIAN